MLEALMSMLSCIYEGFKKIGVKAGCIGIFVGLAVGGWPAVLPAAGLWLSIGTLVGAIGAGYISFKNKGAGGTAGVSDKAKKKAEKEAAEKKQAIELQAELEARRKRDEENVSSVVKEKVTVCNAKSINEQKELSKTALKKAMEEGSIEEYQSPYEDDVCQIFLKVPVEEGALYIPKGATEEAQNNQYARYFSDNEGKLYVTSYDEGQYGWKETTEDKFPKKIGSKSPATEEVKKLADDLNRLEKGASSEIPAKVKPVKGLHSKKKRQRKKAEKELAAQNNN